MKNFNQNNNSISEEAINLIITRYNIPTTFGKKTELKAYKKEWLIQRKEFFINFCYPSILKQKNQNFYWFILFGKETDLKYIESLGTGFIPILAQSFDEGIKLIKETLNKYLNNKKYKFSITRLDSDDALSNNFMEVINNFVSSDLYPLFNNKFALNLRTGLELDINFNVYKRDFPNNSFSTVFEYTEALNLNSIYSFDHNNLSKLYNTFSLTSEDLPFWTMNIHDDNVGNTIKGKRLTLKDIYSLQHTYLPFKIDLNKQ